MFKGYSLFWDWLNLMEINIYQIFLFIYYIVSFLSFFWVYYWVNFFNIGLKDLFCFKKKDLRYFVLNIRLFILKLKLKKMVIIIMVIIIMVITKMVFF